MRLVFSGAGPSTVITTQALLKQGHEVIIIEMDKGRIDRLSDELGCSFVHGDASHPSILGQVNPRDCDFLFCLTDSDQANIITALLGRSMGFKRVVPSIRNAELQQMCSELELEDTIIPVQTISRDLVNMVRGLYNVELSTVLKHDARFFTFVAGKDEAKKADDLDLPDDTKFIFYYRGERFYFVDKETRFRKGDEVVILTHSRHLTELNERWNPKQKKSGEGE